MYTGPVPSRSGHRTDDSVQKSEIRVNFIHNSIAKQVHTFGSCYLPSFSLLHYVIPPYSPILCKQATIQYGKWSWRSFSYCNFARYTQAASQCLSRAVHDSLLRCCNAKFSIRLVRYVSVRMCSPTQTYETVDQFTRNLVWMLRHISSISCSR